MPYDDQDKTLQTTGQAATTMKICPKCQMERLPTTTICPADGTLLPDVEAVQKNPLSTLNDTYEFVAETGRGGMAVIYRAKNRETGKVVAIKKMLAATLTDRAFLRFQQEAKAITSLRHPNIIMVHEFGVAEDGEPYMVMDFIEGSDLGKLIKEKGALTIEESMHRFIQLCDALQHAHTAGVLHRDLKPGNVMLSSADGSFADARLVDFGIAKLMTEEGDDAQKLTMTGQLFGSPLYMSPEQCRGFELDARSDIYSMGCVMFETLTGKPPIRGQSILETIMMQVSEPAPSMKEACPDREFSPALEGIIAKALAKDPNDRFNTMRDLMVALMEAGSELRVMEPEATLVVQPAEKKVSVPASVYIGALCFIVAAAVGAFWWQQYSQANASIMTESLLGTSKEFRQGYITYMGRDQLTDKLLKKCVQGSLDLKALDLQGATELTDSGLSYLEELKGLRELCLAETNAGDECLPSLAKLPLLQKLDLRQTNITDEGLKVIAKMPRLTYLSVIQTRITNEGLSTISAMKNLADLSLGYSTKVDGKGIEKLKDMRLRSLTLAGLEIQDGLVTVAQLPVIALFLQESTIKDKDLEALKDMVNLRRLNINGTAISSKGIVHLSNLSSLMSLWAGKTNIDDDAMEYISKLPALNELSLNSTRLTDKCAPEIAKIKSLVKLNLAATDIGDETLAALKELPLLTVLDLQGTRISDKGLLSLQDCPLLTKVNITNCNHVTKDGADRLDEIVNKINDQTTAVDEGSAKSVNRKLEIVFRSDTNPW